MRVLLAAPVAIVAWGVGSLLPEIAGAVVATALYFGAVLALKVVPREVIEAFVGRARSDRA